VDSGSRGIVGETETPGVRGVSVGIGGGGDEEFGDGRDGGDSHVGGVGRCGDHGRDDNGCWGSGGAAGSEDAAIGQESERTTADDSGRWN
jgi:hypothetical protein